METGKVPVEEYEQYAKEFNPVQIRSPKIGLGWRKMRG